ncbi:hypothetical protein [Bacteroides hominis]
MDESAAIRLFVPEHIVLARISAVIQSRTTNLGRVQIKGFK